MSPLEKPRPNSVGEEYVSLKQALERSPSNLADELRFMWDLPEGKPIRVIGRISIKPLQDGRELWFLRQLEHPEKGVGLLYPTLSSQYVEASAFIPPGPSRKILDNADALDGDRWAIAELELSSEQERQKQRNPWLMNVRSGSLRPLSVIPSSWRVNVTGPETARRISALARDEIEGYLRNLILEEDEQLAKRHAENIEAFEKLAADRKHVEDTATANRMKLESEIQSHRERRDKAKESADKLEAKFGKEQERFAIYKRSVEQEKQSMEIAYRRLKELVSDKSRRLVALGLIDPEDAQALLPALDEAEDARPGEDLEAVLTEGFAQIAPFLQVSLAKKGLLYSQTQLRDFLALLRTRDLVVLAGDSGSGKTSLIKSVAEVIGGVCEVIPVKPNWTGPEDLVGYFNPMERCYQPTLFLLALQSAARNPRVPHFICLDEMNLARVEHYFADFLSLLEDRSGATEIPLYTADEERHVVVEQTIFLGAEAEARRRCGLDDNATLEDILRDEQASKELHKLCGFADNESVAVHHGRLRRSLAAQMRTPTSIKLPQNVWFFGAVNMDETTHQLSPKVLDRVHVVRFRNPMLSDWDAIEAEAEQAKQNVPSGLSKIRVKPSDLGFRSEYPAFDRHDTGPAFLAHLSREYLDPLGVEFGFRAIRQSQGYLLAAEAAGMGPNEALDNVIKHKILPKMAFDTARPAGSGRPRIEILGELRLELSKRFESTEIDPETSSVSELGRMMRLAEGNSGIVNYWLR